MIQQNDPSSSRHRMLWSLLLGFVGLADMMATIYSLEESDESSSSWIVDLIGFSFSILWFLNAIYKANQSRLCALKKVEEEQSGQGRRNDEQTSQQSSSSTDAIRRSFRRTVLIQLLCLPIGFYEALYYSIILIVGRMGGSNDDNTTASGVCEAEDGEIILSPACFIEPSNKQKAFLFVLLQNAAGYAAAYMILSILFFDLVSWKELVEDEFAMSLIPTRVSDLAQCQIIISRVVDEEESYGSWVYRLMYRVYDYYYYSSSDQSLVDDTAAAALQMMDNTTDLPWYCKTPFSSVQESFRDALALVLMPDPVSEWPECRSSIQEETPSLWFLLSSSWNGENANVPWYCTDPYYSKMHQICRTVLDWFGLTFIVLVGLGYMLDRLLLTRLVPQRTRSSLGRGILSVRLAWLLFAGPNVAILLGTLVIVVLGCLSWLIAGPLQVYRWVVEPFLPPAILLPETKQILILLLWQIDPIRVYRWNAAVISPLLTVMILVWKTIMNR
mmetsp:Transcript_22179/g.54837  ORF Transcript_22179/g.54837 Transcript_22179/m.54837 type:complete len:500 (+) Transcript_22179:105-1604(+)